MRMLLTNEAPRAGRIPRVAFLALARRASRELSRRAPSTARAGVAVSFASEATSKRLNRAYRAKNSATNVLSFASDSPEELGDIIICALIARREAESMGIGFNRWVSYLFVHGLLHLAGFGHQTPRAERVMEAAARRILGRAYPFS
ncbi:MAG: rRNA maturation RNase YbeY [Parcubacteria group bacterium]|nr:rRNA maturation RNase YbeY [Parcubacteria group bacterium]